MIVGHGVDVIEIARIERALARRGEHFVRKVFSSAEISLCAGASRPAPHFALRFAAKEATMKALGTGWAHGVRWGDIEALPDPAAPEPLAAPLRLRLSGVAAELAGPVRTHLAVGRSRTHAIATVLLERAPE